MEQSAQAQIQELEPGSGKHAQLYGEGKTGRGVGRRGEDYPGACAGMFQRFAIGVARSPEQEDFFASVFQRRKGDSAFKEEADLKTAFRELIATFPLVTAYNGSAAHRSALRDFTGKLIGRYINASRIEMSGNHPAFSVDPDLRIEVMMLKELAWTYVIEASSLAAQQHGQERVITELHQIYSEAAKDRRKWAIFPMFYRERLQDLIGKPEESQRVPVDLIASMTESQAISMHRRLTGHLHDSGLNEILS